MVLSHACDAFLAHRQLARRSPHTVVRYATALRQWQRWRTANDLPDAIPPVSLDELRSYLHYLSNDRIPHAGSPRRPAADDRRGLTPGAVASERSAIRTFWNFCRNEGWLTEEQGRFFARGRMPTPQPDVDEDDRTYWTAATVDALCAAAAVVHRAEQATRDAAIVRLLYASGLRLDELIRLDEEQCDFAARRARIVGKGRKKRWVFWDEAAAEALAAYRAVRRGPDETGPLFRGVRRTTTGKRLTRDSVRARIKRLFREAGLTPPKQAPVHSGRHGFAHAMLDGGAELTEVQQLMGHASPTTTARYLRERPDKLQAVHRAAWRQQRASEE
jgi:integrase/recombinase XerC